ncbi:MAG: hypothetical protein ACYTFT_03585 [Planctomycetota bacterium]|jgi:hypothetical protein
MLSTEDLRRFHDGFIYASDAFLIEDAVTLDPETLSIEAVVDTTRNWPIARYQQGDPEIHPRHVSAPDIMILTGNLGCLHAFFFHGCVWTDGWVGFGNRIHRADFKSIATVGPPMRVTSKELRTRVGPERVVLRYLFEFFQNDRLVYRGDQTAQFFKRRTFDLSPGGADEEGPPSEEGGP